MNKLESQLTRAAEEARRQVATVEVRPVAAVRTRSYRHRALAAVVVAAGVIGLVGATAIIANQNPAARVATAPETTAVTPAADLDGFVEATPPPPAKVYESTLGTPSNPVDITDLVYLAAVVTGPPDWSGNTVADYNRDGWWDDERGRTDRGKAFDYDMAHLIDDDLDRVWISGGHGDQRTEFSFALARYVVVDHLVIYPATDTAEADRYSWIKDYTLVSEVVSGEPPTAGVLAMHSVSGQAADSLEAQRIDVASPTTDSFILTVTSTHPAEDAPEPPSLTDLAIAEIRIFGWTVDSADLPKHFSEPVTNEMIIETVEVDGFPAISSCVNPDNGVATPSRGGTITDGRLYPTARDAFSARLAEINGDDPASLMLSTAGYVEMIKPDGTIGYGFSGWFLYESFEWADNDVNRFGLATLITVAPMDGGWIATSWAASGC